MNSYSTTAPESQAERRENSVSSQRSPDRADKETILEEVITYGPRWAQLHHSSDDSYITQNMAENDFEFDEELQRWVAGKVREDHGNLYYDLQPRILEPSDYTIVRENSGEPLVVGKGNFGKIFAVRSEASGELFAMKLYRKDKREYAQIFEEMGHQHRGKEILKQDSSFVPIEFKGFLKIKDSSPLANTFCNLVPVITLATLVPDVPDCLPLLKASFMHGGGKLSFKKKDWAEVFHLLVKGVQLLNHSGFYHGDIGLPNICILYRDNSLKLSVIDFGCSKFYPSIVYPGKGDVVNVMKIIKELTSSKKMGMQETLKFAEDIHMRRDYDRDTILKEIGEKLDKDCSMTCYDDVTLSSIARLRERLDEYHGGNDQPTDQNHVHSHGILNISTNPWSVPNPNLYQNPYPNLDPYLTSYQNPDANVNPYPYLNPNPYPYLYQNPILNPNPIQNQHLVADLNPNPDPPNPNAPNSNPPKLNPNKSSFSRPWE